MISIVIPNYNGARLLENCLRSLQSQNYQSMEIIVVDNASRDRSIAVVQSVTPQATVLRKEKNLGFAAAVNAGIRCSRGDWVAILNNDTEVSPDWLGACARAIQDHPDAAFFACRIMDFADRSRVYSAGDCYLRAGIGYRRGQEQKDRADFHREILIFSASGCAALYRRQILEEIGGFDEDFFAYLEDVDLGLRLQRAGCHGYYLPKAEVYHHGAATSGGEFSRLAVRLRTRNSLLLLWKSIPAGLLFRCLPMILIAQLSWAVRVLAHLRIGSYLRGLGGALILGPAMLRKRRQMSASGQNTGKHLWRQVMDSESLAGQDFAANGIQSTSLFLHWYFRLF